MKFMTSRETHELNYKTGIRILDGWMTTCRGIPILKLFCLEHFRDLRLDTRCCLPKKPRNDYLFS